MKKIVLVFLFILSITGVSWGDDATNTNSNANSFSSITTYGGDFTSLNSPNLIQANKMDGVNIGIPGIYRNTYTPNSVFFLDLEYKIFQENIWTGEISITEVKNVANWHFFSLAKFTGRAPIDTSENGVTLLPYIPIGAKPVSYGFINVQNDVFPLSPMYSVLDDCWKDGHGKYYTILYRTALMSIGKVLAVGSAAVNSTAHAGSSDPGKSVTSGAAGAGYGTAKGWIDPAPGYIIIGWDSAGKNPQEISKTETKETGGTKYFTFKMAKEIHFDFDSSAIYDEKQLAAIEKNITIIDENLSKLKDNQIFCFFGKASKPGTIAYNRNLTGERAKNVYILTLRQLHKQKGYPLDYLKKRITFSADGKEFPITENKKDSDNQVVVMTVVAF